MTVSLDSKQTTVDADNATALERALAMVHHVKQSLQGENPRRRHGEIARLAADIRDTATWIDRQVRADNAERLPTVFGAPRDGGRHDDA